MDEIFFVSLWWRQVHWDADYYDLCLTIYMNVYKYIFQTCLPLNIIYHQIILAKEIGTMQWRLMEIRW